MSKERRIEFHYTVSKHCVATYDLPAKLVNLIIDTPQPNGKVDTAVNEFLISQGREGGYKNLTDKRIVDLLATVPIGDRKEERVDEEIEVLDVVDVTPPPEYRCPSCGLWFLISDSTNVYPNIPRLLERIEPGESVPVCECPDCHSLVHPDNRTDGKEKRDA